MKLFTSSPVKLLSSLALLVQLVATVAIPGLTTETEYHVVGNNNIGETLPKVPDPSPGYQGRIENESTIKDEMAQSNVWHTYCYDHGPWINLQDARERAKGYCNYRNGQTVFKWIGPDDKWGNRVNFDYADQWLLDNGWKLGFLQFGYRYTAGGDSTWKVIERECNDWLNFVFDLCQDGSGRYTRGGRYHTPSGHVIVDPNLSLTYTLW